MIIKEYTAEAILEVKLLETEWKESIETWVESIKQIIKLDQENYWNLLIRPHLQCMTLQSLTDFTKKVCQALSSVMFKAQLRLRITPPS